MRGCVEVCPRRLALEATAEVDWETLARDQRRAWDRDVKPLLARYPNAGIAYFWLAPIPLAVQLGTLTERWPAVYVFQRRHDGERWPTGIVDTAVRTMWAFDAFNERGSLEVRRINRYLLWYTQLVRLERASSLSDAVAALADKPVVELVGPPVAVRNNRWVAKLDGSGPLTYELVMLTQRGDLVRAGSTNAASVIRLATALGAHDGDTVRETIRGVFGPRS